MNTFKEYYGVKLNYQRRDGFWVVGHMIDVCVDVEHGVNEKNNHAKAEQEALKVFPSAKITRVDLW